MKGSRYESHVTPDRSSFKVSDLLIRLIRLRSAVLLHPWSPPGGDLLLGLSNQIIWIITN